MAWVRCKSLLCLRKTVHLRISFVRPMSRQGFTALARRVTQLDTIHIHTCMHYTYMYTCRERERERERERDRERERETEREREREKGINKANKAI